MGDHLDDPRVRLCGDCLAALAEFDLGNGPVTVLPGEVLVDLVELLVLARRRLDPGPRAYADEFIAFFFRGCDLQVEQLLNRVAHRTPYEAEALLVEWLAAHRDETGTGVTGDAA